MDFGQSNFLPSFKGGVGRALEGAMKEREREREGWRAPPLLKPHGKCNWKVKPTESAGYRIKTQESASPGFELPPPVHGCLKLRMINHLSGIQFPYV